MDGFSAQETRKPTSSRWRRLQIFGLMFRVIIALFIGWMIVMAFFATSALSH